MGKSRDRANRSGTDPINISDVRLSLEGSNDIKVTAQDGTTLKKVFAEELQVGTGSDRVILKRDSSTGKVQFQTTDGSTTETTQVGTGVVTNPGDLPLTGNSAGDTKFVTSNNNLMIYNGTGWYKIATVTNSSPTISSAGNASYSFATDGTPVIVEITATDPEGLALQYKYQVTSGSLGSTATVTSSSTSGGTYSAINANTLTSNKYFKVTPSTNTAHAGTFSLTFSASDGVNVANSSASSFTLQFSTYGSVLFDGNSDYLLTATDSNLVIGSGDFTAECWIYPKSFAAVQGVIDRRRSGDAANYDWTTYLNTDNTINFYAAGGTRITSSALSTNQWYHTAVVKNSGTTTLYVDGVSQGTWSDSSTYPSNQITFGAYGPSLASLWYDGYISNFRLVIGTAVYTTDFTPAGPLTDITNTKLLTAHKSTEIVDGSSNGVTITKSGDATAHASNPFPIDTTGYGSLYFDGSGDHAIAEGSNLVVGTNDFTIEYWVWASNFSSVGTVFDMRKDHNTSIMNNISTSGEIRLYANSGYRITADPISANTWNHVALQRASGTTKMYLNGKEQSTTYSDTNNYTGDKIYFGSERDTTTEMTGYISNFRQVIGSNVYTINAATGASTSFDGSGDYIDTTNPLSGTGDFTMEGWIYHTTSGSYDGYFSTCQASGADGGIVVGIDKFFVTHGGGSSQIGFSGGAIGSNGVWYHVALQRISNVFYLYKDGVQQGSATATVNLTGSTIRLGSRYMDNTTHLLTGYISNFRIVTGSAVYAASGFTPPTSPLTAISGTQLLTCQNSTGSITDASSNGYTITANGNAAGNTATPFVANFTVPTSPLTAVTNTKLLTAQRSVPLAVTNGSTIFDGTDDYLKVSNNTSFRLGTGDFTIEMWVNFTTTSLEGGSNRRIFALHNGGNAVDNLQIVIDNGGYRTNGDLFLYSNSDQGYLDVDIRSAWHHIAVVRNSGTLKFYLDGVEKDSNSNTQDYSPGGVGGPIPIIGQRGDDKGDYDGYISNFRMVVGTAVYTSNFSVPTAPLTAITNTQILTCQNSTGAITDASASNHTITTFGNAAASSFTPTKIATDQSTNGYNITINGNTRNAKNWPFNYSG